MAAKKMTMGVIVGNRGFFPGNRDRLDGVVVSLPNFGDDECAIADMLRMHYCARWEAMEAPGGVEPPTNGLGNRCSIQLSYGAMRAWPHYLT